MTNETLVYGASDDLIELEGQISNELGADCEAKTLLAFSDGTLLEVYYDDDGIWRIKRLAAGACEFKFEPGSVEEDRPDKARLTGDLRWCLRGERDQYNPVIVKQGR